MDPESAEMTEILDAVAALHRGEKNQARARLLRLWDELSPNGAPIQLSTMAHFLADTEADAAGELEWDLRALEAATGSRDVQDRDAVSPELTGNLPSLHLSVANGWRRLGDLDRARLHVAIAAGRVDVLADDDYGKLVRGGLRRLQAALA